MDHSKMPPVIVWFRYDLRLADNPALTDATSHPIIPLFIWDDGHPHNPGGAAQWWLNQSLIALEKSLASHGLTLILRKGNPLTILKEMVVTHKVAALYWNRAYDEYSQDRDAAIKKSLSTHIDCHSFNGSLMTEPWHIKTQGGTPYQVFTPYWNNLRKQHESVKPLPVPPSLQGYPHQITSEPLEKWHLHPRHPDWSKGMADVWTPGEKGALTHLHHFLTSSLSGYHKNRNFPGKDGTSKLSPHLHWGEISPRQVWAAVQKKEAVPGTPLKDIECFLRELGWREFSYYLLYHFPTFPHKNFQKKFDHFPWHRRSAFLKAWQRGETGYPLVDAGMRELWQTGYMHNRVRMVVGSFLIKNLLIDWREGAAWFLDCLVDADLASNSVNWQWVAGSGVDASPYFRIFNPLTQAKTFDPDGAYIRRFVPELAHLPLPYLFSPGDAPPAVLDKAGIILGHTYPNPMIDLKTSRMHALEAFKTLPASKES